MKTENLEPVLDAEFSKILDDFNKASEALQEYRRTHPTKSKIKPSNICSVFAQNLVTLRQLHGISQKTLATAINTSRQAVAQYEDGSTIPNIDKLYNIASFFNVSADYLLGIETDSVKATQEMLIKQAQNELLEKIIALCAELKK